MTDNLKRDVPESARKVIEAIVSQALARCDQAGIAWEDFYRELLEEQKLHSDISVAELFERTFRRLDRVAN